VGQNLLAGLKAGGHDNIVVLDKHAANLQVLVATHPDIPAEFADFERDAKIELKNRIRRTRRFCASDDGP